MIETMIEVTSLTKRYGATKAIEDVSFQVRPGEVTGLLGPNGAGKSTTMAIILGLKSPTSGRALVAGRRYVDLPAPLRTVGALLEGAKAHPRHTVHSHLRWVAVSHGIARARVDEVVRTVGLERHVSRLTEGLSTGQRQRLGLATALLGDPSVLVLDEPGTGLDVEASRWLRESIRSMAREGRTVLVSSHVLSWIEAVADRLLVLVGGRLIADFPPSALGGENLEEGYFDLLRQADAR